MESGARIPEQYLAVPVGAVKVLPKIHVQTGKRTNRTRCTNWQQKLVKNGVIHNTDVSETRTSTGFVHYVHFVQYVRFVLV